MSRTTKKWLPVILVAILIVLSFISCQKNNDPAKDNVSYEGKTFPASVLSNGEGTFYLPLDDIAAGMGYTVNQNKEKLDDGVAYSLEITGPPQGATVQSLFLSYEVTTAGELRDFRFAKDNVVAELDEEPILFASRLFFTPDFYAKLLDLKVELTTEGSVNMK